ncbi:MAG: hypothetical protein IH991_12340 [Planctomycetes bacterium]|nr:hypothetical protein [Planctomycetota bacterium]
MKDQPILLTLSPRPQNLGNFVASLGAERTRLRRQLRRDGAEIQKLTTNGVGDIGKLADLHERTRMAERRLSEIEQEVRELQEELVSDDEVSASLAAFEPLWETLSPREQRRVIDLLVEQIDFDGKEKSVSITFRPSGIKTLGSFTEDCEEAVA